MAPPPAAVGAATFVSVGATLHSGATGAIGKKLAGGLQTNNNLLLIDKDLVASYRGYSQKMGEAAQRSKRGVASMTSPEFGEMSGLLRAWEGLVDFLTTSSAAADEVAYLVNGTPVKQLTESITALQQCHNRLRLQENGANALIGQRRDRGAATGPSATEMDRLQERVALAEEELEASVKSKAALQTRFGTSLKPALAEKADERIAKADLLRKKAEKQLGAHAHKQGVQISSLSPRIARNENTPRNTDGPQRASDARLSPSDFAELDAAEVKRLNALRESMAHSARALVQYHKKVNASLLKFVQSVENFEPALDIQMYLAKLTNKKFDFEAAAQSAPRPRPVVTEDDMQFLAGTSAAPPTAAAPRAATPTSATHRSPRNRERSPKTARNAAGSGLAPAAALTAAVASNGTPAAAPSTATANVMKHGDMAGGQGGLGGAIGTVGGKRRGSVGGVTPMNKEVGGSPSKAAKTPRNANPQNTLEMSPVSKQKKKSTIFFGSGTTLLTGAGGFSGTGGGSSSSKNLNAMPLGGATGENVGKAENSTGRLRRPFRGGRASFSPLAKGRKNRQDGRSPQDLLHDHDLPGSAREQPPPPPPVDTGPVAPTVYRPVLAPDMTPVSSGADAAHLYVPNIEAVLAQPIMQSNPLHRALELQKRFEDFLLSLRNVELVHAVRSGRRWDEIDYTLGSDAELGTTMYPLKIPGGSPYDVSQVQPKFALEWGARRLDDYQWRCIAYEMLLLCYDHMNHIATARQLAELHNRDIRLISADEYNPGEPIIFRSESLGANIVNAKGSKVSSKKMKRSMRPETHHADLLSMAVQEDNLSLVRRIVMLLRVKLGINSSTHSRIVQLTLGQSCVGAWSCVHPLDVRYRVVRLLDSWVSADELTEEGVVNSDDRTVREWVLRQIHVVHCAITFRVCRLLKFLPERPTEWMHDWTDRGPWYRYMHGRLPRFSQSDLKHFKGKPQKILQNAEEALAIIAGLARAVDQGRWGEEIVQVERDATDLFRSKSGIIRLFQLMSHIDSLDRAFRNQTVEQLNKETGGKKQDSNPPIEENPDDDNTYSLMQAGQDLVMSWPHEVPFIQLVLAYIWRICFDNSSSDKLHVDAKPLAQGVLVAAVQFQTNEDLTRRRVLLRVPVLSMESHAVLCAQSLLEFILETEAEDDLDLEVDDTGDGLMAVPVKRRRQVAILSVGAVKTLHKLLCKFPQWLMENEEHHANQDEILPADMIDPTAVSFDALRSTRLLKIVPQTPAEAMRVPSGVTHEFGEECEDSSLSHFDFSLLKLDTLNDFAVSNVDVIPDESPVYGAYEECQMMVQRNRGGLMLTVPSRVERVMSELIMRRLICSKFFSNLRMVLEDYRLRLEPDSLGTLIDCWNVLWAKMQFDGGQQIGPGIPEVSDIDPYMSLPLILRGPNPQHDMYRFFISRSARNLFERVFDEIGEGLREPISDEMEFDSTEYIEKVVEICAQFHTSLRSYIDEIRCELEFFPCVWSKYLPDNQHAAIVMYSCRRDLAEILSLLINSDWWPDEDVAPGGTDILSGVRSYERLEDEVRIAVTHHVSTKPDLIEPFAPSITAAMSKRFKAVEGILERCMQSEIWEPVNPPSSPYSPGVVDFFSFISHVFESIWSLCAPVDWVLPSFLQFLGRVAQDYCNFVRSNCQNVPLNVISDRSTTTFQTLHNPIARAHGAAIKFAGFKKKKDHKNLGFLKGLGFGKKKKPTAANDDSKAAVVAMSILPDDEDVSQDGSDDSDKQSDTSSLKSTAKKSSKKAAKSKPEFAVPLYNIEELTPEQQETALRIGKELVCMLKDVHAVGAENPLTCWLVRIHNLQYFCDQLPIVANKFLEFARSDKALRDERSESIQSSLSNASTGKSHMRNKRAQKNRAIAGGSDPADDIFNRMQDLLQEVTGQCQTRIKEKCVDVCRILSRRIVYVELGPDIFEDLYHPAFGADCITVEHIVNALRLTVGRFVAECPLEFRSTLSNFLLIDLVKAWVLLLTEMGYAGHVFMETDLAILDEDLEALKDYAIQNSMNTLIQLEGEGSEVGAKVDIFDYVNDFFVLIASRPDTLAVLGGHARDKSKTDKKVTPDAADKAELKQPEAQAFDAAMIGEMTGEAGSGLFSALSEKKPPKPKKKKILGFI